MEEKNGQPNILNTKDIKTIHTYTSDMADAIRENEASVIKIALAEKDKREREQLYQKASGTPLSKSLLTIGGIILIGVAVAVSYFVIKKNKAANAPQEEASAEIPAVISYDDKAFIDVTNITNQIGLGEAIQAEIVKEGKPRSIKTLFLTRETNGAGELLSAGDFFSLTKAIVPDPLLRTIDAPYMVGTYTPGNIADKGTDPLVRPHLFLIFRIKDYNQAYASMLEWEKTMITDLFVLFNINVAGDRNELFVKPWKDVTINNKDARFLYDRIGNDVLYYIFPDRSTFIITDNQETIKEVSTRLIAKDTKPL